MRLQASARIYGDEQTERDIRHCPHDKDVACCWCALNEPCHADVPLRIANSRRK